MERVNCMSLLTAKYLGRHVLAEFWRCQGGDDPKRVEQALVIAAQAAGEGRNGRRYAG